MPLCGSKTLVAGNSESLKNETRNRVNDTKKAARKNANLCFRFLTRRIPTMLMRMLKMAEASEIAKVLEHASRSAGVAYTDRG